MPVSARTFAVCLSAFSVFLLPGCSSGPDASPERVLAEAYAGPATLKLHRDIDPRSPESVTVKHGDLLQIVGRRRRFVKVRTASGQEGWTETRQLMAAAEMNELNGLAEAARQQPSQGAATVYEGLNVHTEPNRLAPSFYRIKAGETADVIAHRVAPRTAYEGSDIMPPPPPRAARAKKPREEPRIPRVPPPPTPKPPDNWLELSKTAMPEPETPEPAPEPPKPVPADDWTLVRLKNGRAGWVITSSLRMEIPDEVAQYSEGARITAYFSMAKVNDGGQVRHHWLWTTLRHVRSPYQFDSFRYFIWNTRRHRYETAYIEKDLKGYLPVEVGTVNMTASGKQESFPSFTLLLEDSGGARWKKTYAFQFYRVVLARKEAWDGTVPFAESPKTAPAAAPRPPAPPRPGLYTRLKSNLASLKRKVFGN